MVNSSVGVRRCAFDVARGPFIHVFFQHSRIIMYRLPHVRAVPPHSNCMMEFIPLNHDRRIADIDLLKDVCEDEHVTKDTLDIAISILLR